MNYQIAITVTISANTEDEARENISLLLQNAEIEPSPLIDFSIEETMDTYED